MLFIILKNDNLLNDYGILKLDIERLQDDLKKTLNEQKEDKLGYIKNEEESISGKSWKKMEKFDASLYDMEDVINEKSLISLLYLTDLGILTQSRIMNYGINKNSCFTNNTKTNTSKVYIALQLIDYFFHSLKNLFSKFEKWRPSPNKNK